jgi:hypothetical protein
MLKKTMLGLLKDIPPHITKTILEAWHQKILMVGQIR